MEESRAKRWIGVTLLASQLALAGFFLFRPAHTAGRASRGLIAQPRERLG